MYHYTNPVSSAYQAVTQQQTVAGLQATGQVPLAPPMGYVQHLSGVEINPSPLQLPYYPVSQQVTNPQPMVPGVSTQSQPVQSKDHETQVERFLRQLQKKEGNDTGKSQVKESGRVAGDGSSSLSRIAMEYGADVEDSASKKPSAVASHGSTDKSKAKQATYQKYIKGILKELKSDETEDSHSSGGKSSLSRKGHLPVFTLSQPEEYVPTPIGQLRERAYQYEAERALSSDRYEADSFSHGSEKRKSVEDRGRRDSKRSRKSSADEAKKRISDDDEDPEHYQAQVFITHLPLTTTLDDMRDILKHFEKKLWLGHKKSQPNDKCVFVRLSNMKEGKRLISEFNGYMFLGRSMEVRYAAAADFQEHVLDTGEGELSRRGYRQEVHSLSPTRKTHKQSRSVTPPSRYSRRRPDSQSRSRSRSPDSSRGRRSPVSRHGRRSRSRSSSRSRTRRKSRRKSQSPSVPRDSYNISYTEQPMTQQYPLPTPAVPYTPAQAFITNPYAAAAAAPGFPGFVYSGPEFVYQQAPIFPAPVPSTALYLPVYRVRIGNLSPDVTVDSLDIYIGTYNYSRLELDENDGETFALVDFNSIEEAERLMDEIDGKSCLGRIMRLSFITPGDQSEEPEPSIEVPRSQEKSKPRPKSRSPEVTKSLFQTYLDGEYAYAVIIGKKYIHEYMMKTGNKAFYVCVVCEEMLVGKNIASHVVGYKHRLKYCKRYTPRMYEKLSVIKSRDSLQEECAKYAEDHLVPGDKLTTHYSNDPELKASEHLKKVKDAADQLRRKDREKKESEKKKKEVVKKKTSKSSSSAADSTSDILKRLQAYKKKLVALHENEDSSEAKDGKKELKTNESRKKKQIHPQKEREKHGIHQEEKNKDKKKTTKMTKEKIEESKKKAIELKQKQNEKQKAIEKARKQAEELVKLTSERKSRQDVQTSKTLSQDEMVNEEQKKEVEEKINVNVERQEQVLKKEKTTVTDTCLEEKADEAVTEIIDLEDNVDVNVTDVEDKEKFEMEIHETGIKGMEEENEREKIEVEEDQKKIADDHSECVLKEAKEKAGNEQEKILEVAKKKALKEIRKKEEELLKQDWIKRTQEEREKNRLEAEKSALERERKWKEMEEKLKQKEEEDRELLEKLRAAEEAQKKETESKGDLQEEFSVRQEEMVSVEKLPSEEVELVHVDQNQSETDIDEKESEATGVIGVTVNVDVETEEADEGIKGFSAAASPSALPILPIGNTSVDLPEKAIVRNIWGKRLQLSPQVFGPQMILSLDPRSTLQMALNKRKLLNKPGVIVGLDKVTEVLKMNDDNQVMERYFHCGRCSVTKGLDTFIVHLQSTKHKSIYVKRVHGKAFTKHVRNFSVNGRTLPVGEIGALLMNLELNRNVEQILTLTEQEFEVYKAKGMSKKDHPMTAVSACANVVVDLTQEPDMQSPVVTAASVTPSVSSPCKLAPNSPEEVAASVHVRNDSSIAIDTTAAEPVARTDMKTISKVSSTKLSQTKIEEHGIDAAPDVQDVSASSEETRTNTSRSADQICKDKNIDMLCKEALELAFYVPLEDGRHWVQYYQSTWFTRDYMRGQYPLGLSYITEIQGLPEGPIYKCELCPNVTLPSCRSVLSHLTFGQPHSVAYITQHYPDKMPKMKLFKSYNNKVLTIREVAKAHFEKNSYDPIRVAIVFQGGYPESMRKRAAEAVFLVEPVDIDSKEKKATFYTYPIVKENVLIGLSHVTELQGMPGGSLFRCDLCMTPWFETFADLYEHMMSALHITGYLRIHDPNSIVDLKVYGDARTKALQDLAKQFLLGKKMEAIKLAVMEDEPKKDLKVSEKPTVKVEVKLYKMLEDADRCNVVVGLDSIKEIQGLDPAANPKYECQLCNTTVTAHFIVSHLTGAHHKYKYLKTSYPDLLKKCAGKIQKADQYVTEIVKQHGWQPVTVKKIRCTDPNGNPVYEESVTVPVPFARLSEQLDEEEWLTKLEAFDQDNTGPDAVKKKQKDFEDLIQGLDYTPLLGIEYMRELRHPTSDVPSFFECMLCHMVRGKTLLCQFNVIKHICTRGHRLNYFVKTDRDWFISRGGRSTLISPAELDGHTKDMASKQPRKKMAKVVIQTEEKWKSIAATMFGDKAFDKTTVTEEKKVDDKSADVTSKVNLTDQASKTGVTEATSDTVDVFQYVTLNKPSAWEKLTGMIDTQITEGDLILTKNVRSLLEQQDPSNQAKILGLQHISEVQVTSNWSAAPSYICHLCFKDSLSKRKLHQHCQNHQHTLRYIQKGYPEIYNRLKDKKFTSSGLKDSMNSITAEILWAEKSQELTRAPQVLLDTTNKFTAFAGQLSKLTEKELQSRKSPERLSTSAIEAKMPDHGSTKLSTSAVAAIGKRKAEGPGKESSTKRTKADSPGKKTRLSTGIILEGVVEISSDSDAETSSSPATRKRERTDSSRKKNDASREEDVTRRKSSKDRHSGMGHHREKQAGTDDGRRSKRSQSHDWSGDGRRPNRSRKLEAVTSRSDREHYRDATKKTEDLKQDPAKGKSETERDIQLELSDVSDEAEDAEFQAFLLSELGEDFVTVDEFNEEEATAIYEPISPELDQTDSKPVELIDGSSDSPKCETNQTSCPDESDNVDNNQIFEDNESKAGPSGEPDSPCITNSSSKDQSGSKLEQSRESDSFLIQPTSSLNADVKVAKAVSQLQTSGDDSVAAHNILLSKAEKDAFVADFSDESNKIATDESVNAISRNMSMESDSKASKGPSVADTGTCDSDETSRDESAVVEGVDNAIEPDSVKEGADSETARQADDDDDDDDDDELNQDWSAFVTLDDADDGCEETGDAFGDVSDQKETNLTDKSKHSQAKGPSRMKNVSVVGSRSLYNECTLELETADEEEEQGPNQVAETDFVNFYVPNKYSMKNESTLEIETGDESDGEGEEFDDA